MVFWHPSELMKISEGVANGLSAAETRTPVALGDLPAPVQKAVGAQLAGFTVGTIERVVSEGETTFEIEATKAGKRSGRFLTISAMPSLASRANSADLSGGAMNSIAGIESVKIC